jgi:hypothetical protein
MDQYDLPPVRSVSDPGTARVDTPTPGSSPTSVPSRGFHPKVTAAALAGALTTILLAEANRRGYPIDGFEGAAISTVLTFGAGYVAPSA